MQRPGSVLPSFALVGCLAALGACSGGDDSGPLGDPGLGGASGGAPPGGATGGTAPTGGLAGTGGAIGGTGTGGSAGTGAGPSSGGVPSSGGASGSGGAPELGGAATGGANSGGTATGGGPSGGTATGGASSGGTATGGGPSGGTATGGASSGGTATGGGPSGGTETGGASTGGEPTGGTGTGGTADSSPVGRHGQLQVVGTQLQDASGNAVILRGQGFGWDNWWPQYYNADVVAWLRDDWCVDMLRPAMGIEPEGAYLANPDASRARIQTVVDAAIAEGLYVIIDWHAHDLHQSEAVAFFAEMAETYGNTPNVIYEIFNEPEGETWPEVKSYAEAVIGAIRQQDPDNLVIVGCPEWDQRIDLVAADPITDYSNLLYAVHFYAATHGAWLRDRTAAAIGDGVPVIVSESSGSESSGQGANDYTEWQAWFDFMDANHISWIDYSISDKAGETISVLEPGAPANGGWDASQLTETGEYIRDVFRSYCE